jgi:hypothetical protein
VYLTITLFVCLQDACRYALFVSAKMRLTLFQNQVSKEKQLLFFFLFFFFLQKAKSLAHSFDLVVEENSAEISLKFWAGPIVIRIHEQSKEIQVFDFFFLFVYFFFFFGRLSLRRNLKTDKILFLCSKLFPKVCNYNYLHCFIHQINFSDSSQKL